MNQADYQNIINSDAPCQAHFKTCYACTTSASCDSYCESFQYYKTPDSKCYSCSSALAQCIQCAESDLNEVICSACNNPYKLTQGTCQTRCDRTQQDSDRNRICQNCNLVLPNCLECNEAGSYCTLCDSNYYVGGDILCHPCTDFDAQCATCSISGCSSCSNLLKLTSGACQNNCVNTQQDSNSDRICQNCNLVLSNCQECSEAGTQCTMCDSGYYIGGDNLCHSCTVIDTQCSSCANGVTCDACNNPYKLTINTCQINCNSTQQDSDSNRICLNCNVLLTHCQQCNEAGSYCTLCDSGYFVGVDNLCHPCTDFDAQCVTCSISGCSSCINPLKATNGTCQSNCVITQQDRDSDRICQNCNLVLSNCQQCNEEGSYCKLCDNGYYVHTDQACHQCSEIIQFCKFCSQDSLTCSMCFNPYKLTLNACQSSCDVTQQDSNSDQICQDCNLVLPNCLECNEVGNQCTLCDSGYYVHTDQTCHQCSEAIYFCEFCSQDGSTCLSCLSPKLLDDNKCLSSCSSSKQDSNSDRICEDCNQVLPNCSQCNHQGNICTLCDYGFYIDLDQKCSFCSNSIQDCQTCDQLGIICYSCLNPKKLVYNSCVDDCPDTQYDDGSRICNFCQNSINNCIECNELGTDCTLCQSGYFINALNQCSPCSTSKPDCNTCDQQGFQCYSCDFPWKLSFNQCVAVCPTSQFDDGSRICKNCGEKLQCQQCEGDMKFINDSCVLECSYNQIKDGAYCKTCQQYIQNCEKCNLASKSCEKCLEGYFMLNQKCIQCFQGCKICDEKGCLSCNQGYQLINKSCEVKYENNDSQIDNQTLKQPNDLDDFNITNEDKTFIQYSSTISDTVYYTGASLSAVTAFCGISSGLKGN